MRTRSTWRLLVAGALATALATTGVAQAQAPDDDEQRRRVVPSELVPQPVVTGPTSGGIRTGKPFGASQVPLDAGWVEQEFFFEGLARPYAARATGLPQRAYRSRILVRRPVDPRAFSGTVVLDWNNVTLGFDKDVSWAPMHRTLMDRGIAYVGVAAQLLSIEGSPLALKPYDPDRYGTLSHPGDDYSFDIFSQAAEAVLDDKVLGALRPRLERRLAVGASQSAGRLKTYINEVHDRARVFDGFSPQISGSDGVARTLAPVLWVNSQAEVPATPVPPDSDLFRLWELAGPAHTSHGSDRYQDAVLQQALTSGLRGSYDAEDALAWGYQAAPGSCLTANYLSSTWAWSASIVALDDWVRTGSAPPVQPRAARDAAGTRLFDARGGMLGGVRLPYVEVPVASYFTGGNAAPTTDPCGRAGGALALKGTTRVFDAATLEQLYPDAGSFLTAFDAATARALRDGVLLPEGARDLQRRARVAADTLLG